MCIRDRREREREIIHFCGINQWYAFVIRKKLKEARIDATAMTHQINDNLKKITENEKRARDLGNLRNKTVVFPL